MKRFSRLLCLLIATVLLCACGSDADPADSARPENDNVARDVVKDFLAGEKQVIKIAAVERVENWLPAAVTMFNMTNARYYAEVTHYTERNYQTLTDGNSASDEAVAKFNMEITTGSVPDIVILPNRAQTNSYVAKGLFADLNEFMENDPDFDRDDYLPSLFAAFDRDGKMYEISPMFNIDTILVKTADAGNNISWTLEEFAAFIESKPDAQYIIGDMTKRDFIVKMTQYLFVNPVTLEIKFDRDEFIKILKVAERFPTDLPHEFEFLSREYQEFMTGARDGDPLMVTMAVFGFFTPTNYKNYFFGLEEEVTYKGWPSSADNGIRFTYWGYASILKPSENSDGAWEFLKYALNHAKDSYGVAFPANLALLDKMAEDEFNRWKNRTEPYYTLTQENIAEIKALLNAANTVYRENLFISRIVDEEIGSYLSGQRPVETIIDIIENRISLYLAEQK